MTSDDPLRFNGPAVYKISVKGKLLGSLLDSFGNISIHEEISPNGTLVSIISVRIKDQAELAGIINTVYEWRLPLISVDCESNQGD